MNVPRAVLVGTIVTMAVPLFIVIVMDSAAPIQFLWIRTLVFGRGAAITSMPVTIPTGKSFFQAPSSLKPVDDAMRVDLDIGPATDENKDAVLRGEVNLTDIGNLEVAVCKSPVDCTPMNYCGPYYSQDYYGIGFNVHGLDRNTPFVGVSISVDRRLYGVRVNWSNFVQ